MASERPLRERCEFYTLSPAWAEQGVSWLFASLGLDPSVPDGITQGDETLDGGLDLGGQQFTDNLQGDLHRCIGKQPLHGQLLGGTQRVLPETLDPLSKERQMSGDPLLFDWWHGLLPPTPLSGARSGSSTFARIAGRSGKNRADFPQHS